MNRAEKRRQKKLADKAAKRTQSVLHAQANARSPQSQQTMAIQQAIELGRQHHSAGDLLKAEGIYQQILQTEPNQHVVLHLLGTIAYQLGKNDVAIDLIGKALSFNPDYVDAHINIGTVLHDQGKLDGAIASFHKALTINPDHVVAHYNLANALKAQGKLDQAVVSYQKAISIVPDYVDAHSNLGSVFIDQGKLDEAIACFHMAISIKPDYVLAHNNLGNALKEQGKLDDAVASYHKALDIKPNFAEVYNNLGSALNDQGKLEDAVASCHKALELEPDNDGWHIRKALYLPVIVSSSEEVEIRRSELINTIKELQNCDLSVENPIVDIGVSNFYLAYHDRSNKNILENIARLHLSACPKLAYEAGHCSPKYNRKKGRLRIGFLSLFLKNHTIGKLYKGIIEHFSKDQFEVIFFQPTGKMDEVSEAISLSVDKVVPLHNKLEQGWESIAAEQLDILFYPDIGMAAYTYFLSFARLAPVQVVSWGHPDTTGINNIDYFLSSELIEREETSNQYTEQLVLLSLMPTFYYRPEPTSRAYNRVDYDLPETGALYVCPQSLFKLHPDFDSVLADLLRKDQNGFLVLIDDRVGGNPKKLIIKRLKETFPDISDRIIFIPQMDRNKYLGLTMLADAMLDIPSFSGGNSSLEAFSMSVPIVTWPGEFMRSRVTAGYYAQMGLNELIASNAEAYVSLAYKLAHDDIFKSRMKAEISVNSHKLYERIEVVREMEIFFSEAYKSWQKGEILSNEVFKEVLGPVAIK